MHSPLKRALFLGALVALVLKQLACGGAAATTAARTIPGPNAIVEPAEKADGKSLTAFQRRRLLGHYSTEDGASGFILDRTSNPPRARLDGESKVITLEQEGSGYGRHVLRGESFWLDIETDSGEVRLFDGPKQHYGVFVVRDADADPL